MQTTCDRADFPAGTAVSGSSTADSSGINGPFTMCDALMRERDALVYYRQMLERKRTELENSLKRQRSEKEVCPALFVFPSAEALLRATQSNRVQSTVSTQGIAHQCVHNSAVLSPWSTPIGSGVGARGMTEYQKSFHAHNLTRTLRHAERIYLCSDDLVSFMHTLTTSHLSPMLCRLELNVPEFSEEMAQKISEWEKERRLKYIDIRLNDVQPRVKSLFFLQSMRSLDLSHTTITDENLIGIQSCRRLRKLDLSGCCGVKDIFPISSIQTLEVIKLSCCAQLVSVGALSRLQSLKEVELRKTAVTDEEIRQLSECHTLVKIDLRSCTALTDVNPLSSIATLEVINLSGCTSLAHVGALGKLPVLKEVGLSGTFITDDEVRQLSESYTLVKLDLSWCRTLTNVNPLSSIATLEVINISDCTSLTHVGALGKLRALKEVNLYYTLIADDEVRQLGESHTLVVINLNSCEALTNVNPLSSITTLEKINLSYCTSLAHVGDLGKLPVLKEVDLSETPINDKDVCLLSKSRTLVKIDLNSCDALTNVIPLSSIATLEKINLSYCTSLTRVGDLGKLPVLKELNLSYTRITDEDVRLLSKSRTLVKIDLNSCDALTNVIPLSSIATLEEINLSYCTSLTRVGDLGNLPVLKEVNLSETLITDEDVRLLSKSRTVVKINLSGCEELTNLNPLSSIKTLELIDLSYCASLTHVGALVELPVLKRVWLSETPVTEEDVDSFNSLRQRLYLPPIEIKR